MENNNPTNKPTMLNEGMWDKTKYLLGKLGRVEQGGKIWGRSEQAQKAKAQIAQLLSNTANATIKQLEDTIESTYPEFPNMESREQFVAAVELYGQFYDSIVAATNIDPAQQGYLSPIIANELIKDLRVVVKHKLDYKLATVYNTMNESDEIMNNGEVITEADVISRNDTNSSTIATLKSNKLPLALAGIGASLGAFGWLLQTPYIQELIEKILGGGGNLIEMLPHDEVIGSIGNGEGITQFLQRTMHVDLGPNAPVDNFRDVLAKLGNGDIDKGLENISGSLKDPQRVAEMKDLLDHGNAHTMKDLFDQTAGDPTSGKGGSWFETIKGGNVKNTVIKAIVTGLVKKGAKAAIAGTIGSALAPLGVALIATGAVIKLLRMKGLKNSRAQYLNDLLQYLQLVPMPENMQKLLPASTASTPKALPQGMGTPSPSGGGTPQGQLPAGPETKQITSGATRIGQGQPALPQGMGTPVIARLESKIAKGEAAIADPNTPAEKKASIQANVNTLKTHLAAAKKPAAPTAPTVNAPTAPTGPTAPTVKSPTAPTGPKVSGPTGAKFGSAKTAAPEVKMAPITTEPVAPTPVASTPAPTATPAPKAPAAAPTSTAPAKSKEDAEAQIAKLKDQFLNAPKEDKKGIQDQILKLRTFISQLEKGGKPSAAPAPTTPPAKPAYDPSQKISDEQLLLSYEEKMKNPELPASYKAGIATEMEKLRQKIASMTGQKPEDVKGRDTPDEEILAATEAKAADPNNDEETTQFYNKQAEKVRQRMAKAAANPAAEPVGSTPAPETPAPAPKKVGKAPAMSTDDALAAGDAEYQRLVDAYAAASKEEKPALRDQMFKVRAKNEKLRKQKTKELAAQGPTAQPAPAEPKAPAEPRIIQGDGETAADREFNAAMAGNNPKPAEPIAPAAEPVIEPAVEPEAPVATTEPVMPKPAATKKPAGTSAQQPINFDAPASVVEPSAPATPTASVPEPAAEKPAAPAAPVKPSAKYSPSAVARMSNDQVQKELDRLNGLINNPKILDYEKEDLKSQVAELEGIMAQRNAVDSKKSTDALNKDMMKNQDTDAKVNQRRKALNAIIKDTKRSPEEVKAAQTELDRMDRIAAKKKETKGGEPSDAKRLAALQKIARDPNRSETEKAEATRMAKEIETQLGTYETPAGEGEATETPSASTSGFDKASFEKSLGEGKAGNAEAISSDIATLGSAKDQMKPAAVAEISNKFKAIPKMKISDAKTAIMELASLKDNIGKKYADILRSEYGIEDGAEDLMNFIEYVKENGLPEETAEPLNESKKAPKSNLYSAETIKERMNYFDKAIGSSAQQVLGVLNNLEDTDKFPMTNQDFIRMKATILGTDETSLINYYNHIVEKWFEKRVADSKKYLEEIKGGSKEKAAPAKKEALTESIKHKMVQILKHKITNKNVL